ncbi:MAG: DEAD/DEAH box helicase, partial [Gemmatimonadales bacterium]
DVLIVLAPKRVADLTWPQEVIDWAPELTYRLLTRDGWDWGDQEVLILNYEQIGKLVEMVKRTKRFPRAMMVLDECTCARSPRAKRMQTLRPLFKRSKFVYGLTGTPSPNGYLDLYGQFKWIMAGAEEESPLGTALDRFELEFFTRGRKKYAKPVFREEKRDELFRRLEPYFLAQKRSEYLDLPDIEYRDIEISFPRDLMAKYRELKKNLFITLDEGEVTALSAGVLVKKLLQFTSGKIYDEDRIVLDVHDLKAKAILKIKERPLLIARDFTHSRVPGAVAFDGSKDLIDRWNRKAVNMMIGHPRSMGIGLNLQKGGNTLVWHTPSYSLMDTQQTESRLHRTGQTKPVIVYRVIVKGTVDEAVIESLRAKDAGQNALMTALSYLRRQK